MPAKSIMHLFSIPVGIFIILMTFGCGSITDHQDATGPGGENRVEAAGDFSAPIPSTLARHLVTGGGLTAQVIVDGGAPVNMTVDVAGNKVNGTIGALQGGSHTIEIVYFINGDEVARGSKSVTVAAGATTTVSFAASDLRYTDTDKDGFTNLAEMERGTDWNNPTGKPAAELPRSSANYVLNDTMGVSPTDGKTTVVGVSSSSSY